ncbi:unnamed protein product [Lepidochelys olivacea]
MDFDVIKPQLAAQLPGLLSKLNAYFPELTTEQAATCVCATNPLSENTEAKLPSNVPSKLLEELIDISSDSSLRTRCKEMPLETFWCECSNEYITASSAALKSLIPFAATYLCETGFSAMPSRKTKYRTRTNIDRGVRLCLSKIPPRLDRIVDQHQQQVAH